MKFMFFDSFDNKINKYKVLFNINVRNLTSDENLVQVIMPFPLKSNYQKLLGKYTFIPKGEIRTENKFHNQYIYWRQNLKTKEEKNFELKFNIAIKSRSKPIKDNSNLSRFLKSDKFIDAKKVLKISNDLTQKTKDIYEKVKILNDYVVNNLRYGNPIKGLYTTADTLKKNAVDCGGFNSLFISLCIAQRIPARIVCGFFASLKNEMHAWVEVFLPEKGWIIADPSIEKLYKEGRSKRQARLGYMNSEVIALSLGQDFELKIAEKNLELDILQNPVVFAERGKNSVKFVSSFQASKI